MQKQLLSFLFVLLFSGASCLGDDWSSRVAATSADLFIARPFTFAAMIGGAALWVVTLPITAPTKTHKDALDVMVKSPYRFTFHRDLGEFDE